MAAGAGEVAALMKGSLHTDVLLHAIMHKDAKLRTGRLISHCMMVSALTYARRFVLSDVALNIAPDTNQKRDICQNAIGFARALGIDLPKVAVLAAVEMVKTKMSATLDGGILARWRFWRRWGSGLAYPSGFAILDLLCGLSPRDMNPLVFEHVQPHIRSPLGRLHHDPAAAGKSSER